MNNLKIEFDESSREDEDDVSTSATSFKQLMLWGTDWTVETILNQLKKGNIELNPSYQRRNAWDLNKKSKLIESLTDIPHVPVNSISFLLIAVLSIQKILFLCCEYMGTYFNRII